ncbi:MAG: GHKL domain-containing protein [Bacilli bacterium]|nr:GHKL domain-containing protein [Bacilli bacterium]
MHKWIELFFSSFCVIFSSIYTWNKLNDNKIKKIKVLNVIEIVICCLLVVINYVYVENFIKPLISTIILMITMYCIYKESIKKTIILTIYSQIIAIISELICGACITIVLHINETIIRKQYFGNIITNIFVACVAIVIASLPLTTKLYQKVLYFTDKIKKFQLMFYSTILIFIANILTTYLYYKVNMFYLIIINTSIIIIYTIIIFNYLKTNNNYLKVYDKYNMTLNSLKEYEDILSRYRISNHENKNQLLTIRGMVKNKKVTSYIDEIIENKIKDNEKLMFDSMVIPEGGLRGLIYSKMLLMRENNIEFDLCVDKALKTTDLTIISDDLMLNICNIVGVYLDNAIEAVKELKEKYITIEIYLDDTLNIAIANNYEGDIDLDSIDKVGYSTKGGSHGYGLSLVKEIISKNKCITSNRTISDDEFTQEIRVKYKK